MANQTVKVKEVPEGHRRYAIIMDEAACYVDPIEITTCNREKNGSAHKHYTIWQLELDANGNIFDAGTAIGFHRKEIVEITKEFGKRGVDVYLPDKVEERMQNENADRRITITRERAGNGGLVKLFVDERSGANDVRPIGRSWDS